jgi:hypothetical protein
MGLFSRRKPLVDWFFSCGRAFLYVNGNAVLMEGDPLRDPDLAEIGERLLREKYKDQYNDLFVLQSYRLDEGGLKVWTEDLIKWVVKDANGGKMPS